MDAFETVVSEILQRKGYWVQNSFKVELTREDKAAIGRRTSPRWELDIVACSGRHNKLLVVECKSFLDSPGVRIAAFDGTNMKEANRFKLFNEATLRDVVFERLRLQLFDAGLISKKKTNIKLVLVAGKIRNENDRQLLHEHFRNNDWLLWDNAWLKDKLRSISQSRYENSPVAVVAKLLLRD